MSISERWIKLSETKKSDYYFRKIDLYTMNWKDDKGELLYMNMNDYLISAALFGGPIAVVQRLDEDIHQKLEKDNKDREGATKIQNIWIYNAAGAFISNIQIPKQESEVVNLGWTSDLKLMCLTRKGKLFLYTIHGEMCSHYWNETGTEEEVDENLNIIKNKQRNEDNFISLQFRKNESVQKSCMWGQGCAVYTTERRLLAADDFSVKNPFKSYPLNIKIEDEHDNTMNYAEESIDIENDFYSYKDMNDMIAIPSHISQSNTTEIILSPKDCATLLIASENGIVDRKLFKYLKNSGLLKGKNSQKPCLQLLQLSPDSKMLATVYTNNQGFTECLVFNNTVDTLYLRFDICSNLCPTNLGFCSNECVCLYWQAFSFGDIGQDSNSGEYVSNKEWNNSSTLLLIDCYGEYDKLTFEGPIFTVPEYDGIRVYTNFSAQFIERIHESTISIFKIGSLEPCALLFDAYNEFCSKQSKAIKTIRDIRNDFVVSNNRSTSTDNIIGENEISNLLMIVNNDTNSLKNAIDKCIEAACREFNAEMQQKLLKAAIYGRTFLEQTLNPIVGMTLNEKYKVIEEEFHKLYHEEQERLLKASNKEELVCKMLLINRISSNAFATRCKEIRVLNEIRKSVDIPLSYQQFQQLTARVLIARLAELNHHYLARKICDLLNIEPYAVLEHWACAKIKSQEDDQTVYKAINKQLKKHKSHVSYAKVALRAFHYGRTELAQKLLAADDQPLQQIPLYLNMHEINKAISLATMSSDTDLLILIIVYMMNHFDKKYMFEILGDPEKELARKVFINYCKHIENPKKIGSLHKFLGDYTGSGMFNVLRAYLHYTEEDKDSEEKYLQYLQRAEELFSKNRIDSMNKSVTSFQRTLCKMQKQLENEVGEEGAFIGKSIHDTLYSILIHAKLPAERKDKLANFIQSEFSISKKRFCYVNLKAFAHMGQWDKLENFCFKSGTFLRSTTSPIGYEPFVDACLEKGQEKEALKYIPHVKDLRTKVDYYVSLMKFKEAIEAARDAYDIEMLRYIKSKTTNIKTMNSIEELIAKM